jgi:putative spermidine/putrescine transport system substrate-binding protein
MRYREHSRSRLSRRRVPVLAAAAAVGALCVPTAGLGVSSGTLPASIGKSEGSLSMLAMPGYADRSVVGPFQRNTGCKVAVQYTSSSDELRTLMRGGGAGIDVVSASGDASLSLIRDGDVAPLNVRLIPSWKDFFAAFRGPPTNTVRGKHYGLSVQFAPNLLLYNAGKVRRPASWAVLYAPRNRGKVTVPDNPMFIADAALYLSKAKPALGIRDPYELDQAQLAAVVRLLKAQRPLVASYWPTATDEIASFKSGAAVVGAAWPYQQTELKKTKVPVKAAAPREGMTGWLDSWMVSTKAKHPNCAYRWLRYVASPSVQAREAVFYGATPVNRLACPFMDKLAADSCASYRADAPARYYRAIKFWKTPLIDCGDSRGRTCVPYSGWVSAWTQVTS